MEEEHSPETRVKVTGPLFENFDEEIGGWSLVGQQLFWWSEYLEILPSARDRINYSFRSENGTVNNTILLLEFNEYDGSIQADLAQLVYHGQSYPRIAEIYDGAEFSLNNFTFISGTAPTIEEFFPRENTTFSSEAAYDYAMISASDRYFSAYKEYLSSIRVEIQGLSIIGGSVDVTIDNLNVVLVVDMALYNSIFPSFAALSRAPGNFHSFFSLVSEDNGPSEFRTLADDLAARVEYLEIEADLGDRFLVTNNDPERLNLDQLVLGDGDDTLRLDTLGPFQIDMGDGFDTLFVSLRDTGVQSDGSEADFRLANTEYIDLEYTGYESDLGVVVEVENSSARTIVNLKNNFEAVGFPASAIQFSGDSVEVYGSSDSDIIVGTDESDLLSGAMRYSVSSTREHLPEPGFGNFLPEDFTIFSESGQFVERDRALLVDSFVGHLELYRDWIDGGDGDDIIIGDRFSASTLVGGAGSDTIVASPRSDLLDGDDGSSFPGVSFIFDRDLAVLPFAATDYTFFDDVDTGVTTFEHRGSGFETQIRNFENLKFLEQSSGQAVGNIPIEIAIEASVGAYSDEFSLQGFRPVHANELGMRLDTNVYSFANGVYRSKSFLSDGSAVAHIGSRVLGDKEQLSISIRGTDEYFDISRGWNLNMGFKYWPLFWDLRDAVVTYLERNPETEVLFSGHSLGGAMAQYFMRDIVSEQATSITFGAPGTPRPDLFSPDVRQLHIAHGQDPVTKFLFRSGQVVSIAIDDLESEEDDSVLSTYEHSRELYRQTVANMLLSDDIPDVLRGKRFSPEDKLLLAIGSPSSDIIGGHRYFRADDDVEKVIGLAGDDILFGSKYSEEMFGGEGADRLIGGEGADTLVGGDGDDQFVFISVRDSVFPNGVDVISDFESGMDKINFLSLDANVFLEGWQAPRFIGYQEFFAPVGDLRLQSFNGGTLVQISNNAQLFSVFVDGVESLNFDDFVGLQPEELIVVEGSNVVLSDVPEQLDFDPVSGASYTVVTGFGPTDIFRFTAPVEIASTSFVRNDSGSGLEVTYIDRDTQENEKSIFFVGTSEQDRLRFDPADNEGQLSLYVEDSIASGSLLVLGSGEVGAELSLNNSEVLDRDGVVAGTLVFEWFRNGILIKSSDDPTYIVQLLDIGQDLHGSVQFYDTFGNLEKVFSDSINIEIPEDGGPGGAIEIVGQSRVGQVLQADLSSLTDPRGVVPGSEHVVWLKDGSVLSSQPEDALFLPLTEDDLGHTFSINVSYLDYLGHSNLIVSDATAAVNPSPIYNVVTGSEDNDKIENQLEGTAGADLYLGLDGDDWLIASQGDDSLVGGSGYDGAFYDVFDFTSGVFINNTDSVLEGIAAYSVDKRGFGTDNLSGIQNFYGSQYNDIIYIGSLGGTYSYDVGGNDIVYASLDPGATGGHYFGVGAGVNSFFGTVTSFDIVGFGNIASTNGVTVDLELENGFNENGELQTIIDIENAVGSAQDDILIGSVGANTLSGGEGNDTLMGGDGNDSLYGSFYSGQGEGNDRVFGGLGSDVLIGGRGDDFLNPGDNLAGWLEVNGFQESDLVYGTVGNDTITYTDNVNGYQFLNYSTFPNGIRVKIDGTNNTAAITKNFAGVDTVLDVRNALNFETDSITSVDRFAVAGFQVIGGIGSDNFEFVGETGTGGPSELTSLTGQFVVFRGGDGIDTYDLAGGYVRLSFVGGSSGAEVDLSTNTVANDGFGNTETINGTVTSLRGTNNADLLIGSANDEQLIGQGGDDTLDGAGGFDQLRYDRGPSSEIVSVDLGVGIATGSWNGTAFTHSISNFEWVSGTFSGNDTIIGDAKDNIIEGFGGDDFLEGRGGADLILGGVGDDYLSGGEGNDTIFGGAGSDDLEGGAGSDRFVITERGGSVTIVDFELGIDTLDLTSFSKADALAAISGAEAGSAILTFEDGTILVVDGVDVSPETLLLETIALADENYLPIGAVGIIGTWEEDNTLTVDLSGLADEDGYDPDAIDYQWQRDGVDVVGATLDRFTLAQVDVGTEIAVVVSYTDGGGTVERVTSGPTGTIANINDFLLGSLTFDGLLGVGQILTADASGLSDEDGINPNSIIWSWERRDIDFNLIDEITTGADPTYTIQLEDEGVFLRPKFSYVDNFGNMSFRTVTAGFINTPPSGEITITGTMERGETISVDIGGVVEPDDIILDTISYQWRRDGVDIPGPGDEAEDYVLTAADVGRNITVQVTYFDEGGTEEEFISAAVVPVVPGLEITGTPGPDSLPGDDGDDTIEGLASDDTIKGSTGYDIIDGGEGIDTAVFEGAQAGYTLTLSPTQTIITHRVAEGDGTDTLTSIEVLDFGTEVPLFQGNPMNLDIFDGPTGLSAQEFGAIIELYIAYFNRAPDALGLYYWGTEFSNGFTLFQMATSFFAQPETQATYARVLDEFGNLDISIPAKVGEFVTAVYANVLGRAPDAPGFDYWTNELEANPGVTPALFILSVIGGAKFPSDPTLQTAADQAYLATKSDLGAYFAVIKGMSDLDDAATAMAVFDGSEPSIAATLAAIEEHYADALDPDTGDFLMPLVGVIDDPFLEF